LSNSSEPSGGAAARVAIIHYWLVTWRGGEQVLRAIADLYPGADIFMHVVDKDLARQNFPGHRVRTTFIDHLPFSRRWYQKYLGLMPLALEQLDLRGYDLVISSEAGPAKGVVVDPGALHVCYCHSPMRYVWDMYHDYRQGASWATRILMSPVMHYMRLWDQVGAQRVDAFAANSKFVAGRIRKYYRREAEVIYPPVAVERFARSDRRGDFFLAVGQLVQYKRPDLLVSAFNKSGENLVIIGDGPLLNGLRRTAAANIELLGRQSFESIRDHYARCRALVFPGTEDFGIVPVEAMASGKPVIAYARGGALETVIDGKTGLLFSNQTTDGLIAAVEEFKRRENEFEPEAIRAHALQFSGDRFKSSFSAFIARQLRDRQR
jgi:glycosyltransferase involved in cell wall biosynthesis